MKNQLIIALSYTKQRTVFGMVGIEIDPTHKTAYVRLAKQWKRSEMNRIPGDIKQIYDKVHWDMTFADQLIGQHLIRSIENTLKFEVATITTQKNLKDPENIEAIKVMDMTEMTQLTLSLKQGHNIQFPPKDLTKDMQDLIKQMEMFTEHVTEQGGISYYAPGDELDGLPKALMICCFVGRMSLQHGDMPMMIVQGTSSSQQPQTADESFDDMLDKMLGNESYGGLSAHDLNNPRTRKRLFEPKKMF